MENSKIRNMYSLPPKSPFPRTCPFYSADYNTPYTNSSKRIIIPKYRDGNSLHQRTSSESLVIEEQPSWLDELLDEPESPLLRRGHRRSSSDSFKYMEAANANMERVAQVEVKLRDMNSGPGALWGTQDFDAYGEKNPVSKNNSRVWDSLGGSQEINRIVLVTTEKHETVESCMQGVETNDSSNKNGSASETDSKRSKQQFAQRSRVRKLQYIAELERNVQVLQAEGSEVSSELKFLNQRSLILTMENKSLKQWLENLAKEQLIKYLEHEVLEREIGRLRALYKQQQPPQAEKPLFSQRRTTSMESQFANLSLKHKDSVAVHDGPLLI